MKVHLFSQCIVDMFYPQVGIAAVEVLERALKENEIWMD